MWNANTGDERHPSVGKTNVDALGTIRIEMCRVKITGLDGRVPYQRSPLDPGIVHERSKKAGGHYTG
jgi:hypothetical protein